MANDQWWKSYKPADPSAETGSDQWWQAYKPAEVDTGHSTPVTTPEADAPHPDPVPDTEAHKQLKGDGSEAVAHGYLRNIPLGRDMAVNAGAWGDYLLRNPDNRSLADLRKDRYESYKQADDQAWEEHPGFYGAGATAGFGASMALPQAAVASRIGMTGRLGAMADGAVNGGALGALFGAGDGDSVNERLSNMGHGALFGLGFGTAAGALFGPVQQAQVSRQIDNFLKAGRVAQARALGQEFGLDYTAGQMTRDAGLRAEEETLRTTPGPGQNIAAEMHARQFGDLDPNTNQPRPGQLNTAIENVKNAMGPEDGITPHLAGERLKQAAAPVADSVRAADEVDRGLTQSGGDTIATTLGDGRAPDPLEAAGETARAIRQKAEAHQANTDDLYKAVDAVPGEWSPNALVDMHDNIVKGLQALPKRPYIDPDTTPLAAKALDNLAQRSAFQRGVDPAAPRPITGYAASEIENIRQYLNAMYGQARGADRYALGAIKRQFDDHLAQAAQRGDFSGDAQALVEAQNAARASHAEYQKTYRPQGEDLSDPKKFMQGIIDKNWTPDEVNQRLSAIKNPSVAARIGAHLREVLGDKSPEWAAIKASRWKDLYAGLNSTNAEKVASQIEEFLNGRGQPYAAILYDPGERAGMAQWAKQVRNYGQRSNTTPEYLQALTDIASGTMAPDRLVNLALKDSDNNYRLIRAFKAMGDDTSLGLLRQAHLNQRLQSPAGDPSRGARKIASNLRADLESSLGKELYTPQQQAHLRRFADAVDVLSTQPGTTNPGTAGALLRSAAGLMPKAALKGLEAMGFMGVLGPLLGGAAFVGSAAAQHAGSAIRSARQAARARALMSGDVPALSDGAGRKGIDFVVRSGQRGMTTAPALTQGVSGGPDMLGDDQQP